MSSAVDSSIVLGALNGADPDHAACLEFIVSASHFAFSHALSETFSILTGGKLGFRMPSSQAAEILKEKIAPRLEIVSLTPSDLFKAYAEAEARGVRGGAIYDYLHLKAARKARVDGFCTLNLSDFRSFHRPGDPEIFAP
jgi:predicted nucleic acid-binding protein